MLYKQLYAEIGKLLYAVADIDKVIRPEEKKKLLEIVKNELLSFNATKDKFGTDAGYYAEFEFDFLEEQIADADAAFESFINFTKNHRTALDQKVIKLCVNIAMEIAEAYRKQNRAEKELLKRLKHHLAEISGE